MPRPGMPGSSVPGSAGSLASSGLLSTSVRSRVRRVAAEGGPNGHHALPTAGGAEELHAAVRAPEDRIVCHKRQNVVVSIKSLAVPVETALFQARVAEGDSTKLSGAGIHLEMLGGEDEFAFLSTDDVWASRGARQPEMEIRKVSGEKYATIRNRGPTTRLTSWRGGQIR
ncbi:unnamed protein product [Prorocentrum cordatum]|uniref:Uncharacterized protein n=1 Tax=Prorocentrum cordatum TaxID=2364126 RepID=A0ABN9U241_9DINO|nr:unnamed protein product [Polarella glacialis]